MIQRTFNYLLVIVILAMLLIFAQNYLNFSFDGAGGKYLSSQEVEKMVVIADDREYPLSFSQSLRVVDILNLAVKVDYGKYLKSDEEEFDWEKLIIYLRDKPAVEITPFALVNHQLLFSAPVWNSVGLMREMGIGELNDIISAALKK